MQLAELCLEYKLATNVKNEYLFLIFIMFLMVFIC